MELWVGLFVLFALACLAFLALKAAGGGTGSAPKDAYAVEAYFSDVGGLKARAPVRAAGVTVGRVADIRLDPETHRARVTLLIDAPYSFSQDVSAQILTSGILGEQYVGLEEGGSPDKLAPGDTIEETSSAMVLEKMIGQFMSQVLSQMSK